MYQPGVLDAECTGAMSPSSTPANDCGKALFYVDVSPLFGHDGKPTGCVAALEHNTLRIHVGPGKATVTWQLSDQTSNPAIKDVKFKGAGIQISSSGLIPAAWIQDSGPTISGNSVTASFYKALIVPRNIEFPYQPMVSANINGIDLDCVPVDPGIIVNAD
jgi:hypothetical protein